jgi:agmatinase
MRLASPALPFLGARRVANGGESSAFAFIGLPTGSPYDMTGVNSPAARAPDHLRTTCDELEYADEIGHYDFDLGGPLMPSGRAPDLVDYGDIIGDPRDLEASKQFATSTVRSALERGAVPFVIGGDDSIPPIVLRAYEGFGRVNVLHIDAHIDFRDEVRGVRDGYSSPIRRLREMPWIGQIVQVGMRGVGSAREADLRAALAAGNVIVTAATVHDDGVVAAVVDRMRWDAPWFVAIDVDGFDPSVAPGTGYPLPGGLTYRQGATLIRAIAERHQLAGIDVAEIYPSRDVRSITALTVIRLLITAMGLAVRASGREDRALPEALTSGARAAAIAG